MKSRLAGSTIDFNPGFSLKLKEEIGSGSFSSVYSTSDPRYVVKMINAADPKSLQSYKNEKFAFKTMQRHNNIVFCPAVLDSVFLKGVNYCCLALENCSKGSVISMIVDGKITFQEHQIFRIMFEAISAVHHMHNLPHPIIHRDLKGENLLLGNDGRFKLTDFGSTTTRKIQNIDPDNRYEIEEDINKNTTPTIRAPEQCDLYSGSPITEKVDIWALGCLLYILCFHKQPFESRLATVNCQYFLPDNCQYSKTLLNLFPIIFTVDPRDRPSTGELLSYFESNTKKFLTNFVSKIETVNEYNQDPVQRRLYETSSGLPKHSGPRDRPLSSNHSSGFGGGHPHHKSMHQYSSVTTEAKVRPHFKDVVQKNIAMLTTKTEGWMLQALEENPKGPNQVYVQFLVAKAWIKPQKIKKFYSLLYKKQTRNPESTIISLKTLITLHTYLRKGPNDVYLTKEPPSARFILNSIYQTWKVTMQRSVPSARDKVRDPYTTSLIYEYSEILLRKYDLQDKYHRTFQGNYALDPYFMMPVEENSPIAAPVVEDLLNYLEHLTNFHKMLFLQNHLWKIQCSIASACLDEEYCLISVLAHLLVTFKHATNFITVNENNKRTIQEATARFEDKFASCYEKASKFFERCRGLQDFQLQSSIIPDLTPEVLNEIRRVPILLDVKNESFQIKKFLNNQRSICNLTIPFSYNLAARNINSQITNLEYSPVRANPNAYGNYSPPPRRHSPPQRHSHDEQQQFRHHPQDRNNIETSGIIREERPRHIPEQQRHPDQRLSRRHSNSASSMDDILRPHHMKTVDRPQRVADIQNQPLPSQLDFHANFEAFNQLNAQDDPNVVKISQPVFDTNDLYAGFNFDLRTNAMEANPQLIQQLKQNEGIDLLDVPENQQEDLAMAFSHQMVNTSFFNFGKSQNSNVSGEGKRLENPLVLANNASSSEGVLDQQQNMMNLEKRPSIQKSHSDKPQSQNIQNNRQEEVVQNMPKPSVQKNSSQPDLIEADFYKMSSPERSQSVPQDYMNISPEKTHPNYNTQGMGFRNGPQNFNMNPQMMRNQQMFYNTHGSMPTSGMAFQGRGQFNQQQQPMAFPQGNMGNVGGNMGNMNMNMNFQQQGQQMQQQMPFGGQQQQQQGGGFNQNYANMQVNNNPFGAQPQRSPSFPPQQQPFNPQNMNINNQPQPQPQINVNAVQNKQQPQDQMNQIQPNLSQSTVVPQKVQDMNQQQINAEKQSPKIQQKQQQVQVEEQKDHVVDELDLLFNQPNKNVNNAPVQQEESKQEFEVMKTGEFGGWDELFNIGNNANAQKFIEQENEKKRLEEEARQKKAQNISLVDTSINTSNLKKFFLQEISKNVADWIIDERYLKFINQIGSGGSAEVYRGIWRGTDVAIKKMRLNNLPESRKKEFEREISALMKLRPQQNLVNFMGVSVNEKELCIVMEYCYGGTLFEWLHVKRNVPITLRQRIKMAIDVACGMNYLHTSSPPIMHRDLKSLNLLLDGPIERDSKRFTVKLADFGLAKPQEMAQEKMTGLMGTYHWMAPEIFENKDYTIKADVYSYAIVLYEIITRETPYQNIKNPAAIMRYVTLEKGRPDLSKIPPNCPKQLLDLMMQCWEEDPDKRPFFSEILERLRELESWQLN